MLKHCFQSRACLNAPKLQRSRTSQFQNGRGITDVAADKGTDYNAALANAKPFEDIPSMPMLPFLGTSWAFFPIIGKYDIKKQHLAVADKRRRFGDIYREKFGSMNVVMSFNPDDLQAMFKQEGPYPSRGDFLSLKVYRESRHQWYTSSGLLVLQGKEWQELRSKTQRHLMKTKAVFDYLNPMQEVAREFVEKKIFKARDQNNEVSEFLKELYKWALESIAIVGLDTRLGCLDENLRADSDGLKMINSVQTQFEMIQRLEGVTGNLPFWRFFPTPEFSPTWRKFTKAADIFTEIAFKYINRSLEELKKSADSEDKDLTLLQSMLMTKGLDVSGAMVMVADMLTAGIDTSSHYVGFLLYHLARNPDKQDLLYREITRLLPRKDDKITQDVFNQMRYLKACMKESQRLTPVVGGVVRAFDHDVVISGYRIPAGTMTIVGLQEICKEEKYYTNPKQFLPERWLNKDDKFHPFAYAPFGLGVRSCIGRRLAEQEIICLTTEILRSFKVEYHYEDIGFIIRLVNTPDKSLRFNFIER